MKTEHATAESLGRSHADALTTTRRGSPIRVAERIPVLLRTLRSSRTTLSRGGSRMTSSSGAEWFLDNHHLIEQALGQVRQDLPPSFYRELPWLATLAGAPGPPRSLALAEALLTAEELQLDPEQFYAFVEAYQQHSILTQGEWGAIGPIAPGGARPGAESKPHTV